MIWLDHMHKQVIHLFCVDFKQVINQNQHFNIRTLLWKNSEGNSIYAHNIPESWFIAILKTTWAKNQDRKDVYIKNGGTWHLILALHSMYSWLVSLLAGHFTHTHTHTHAHIYIYIVEFVFASKGRPFYLVRTQNQWEHSSDCTSLN